MRGRLIISYVRACSEGVPEHLNCAQLAQFKVGGGCRWEGEVSPRGRVTDVDWAVVVRMQSASTPQRACNIIDCTDVSSKRTHSKPHTIGLGPSFRVPTPLTNDPLQGHLKAFSMLAPRCMRGAEGFELFQRKKVEVVKKKKRRKYEKNRTLPRRTKHFTDEEK